MKSFCTIDIRPNAKLFHHKAPDMILLEWLDGRTMQCAPWIILKTRQDDITLENNKLRKLQDYIYTVLKEKPAPTRCNRKANQTT